MRSSALNYILLLLLVLLVFGVISFGDVLNVIFYIFMGIVILVLLGVLFFRYRINRLRREMENQGAAGSSRSRRRSSTGEKPDGEVTVEHTTASQTKVVNTKVGEYVEYEDIEEITEEEK